MNYEDLKQVIKRAVIEAAHEVDNNDARATKAAERIVAAVFQQLETTISKVVMKWFLGLSATAVIGWIVKEALTK